MTETATTSAGGPLTVTAVAFFDVLREAGVIKGETWGAWRAFLCALMGLGMTKSEARTFRQCTARKRLPTTAFSEAWLVCGRRSGKSFMLALIAVFLAALRTHGPHLAEGERAVIMVIACDRKQARVIMRFARRLLTGIPQLKRLVQRETAEGIDLVTGTSIEIATASSKTTRGFAVVALLADELAHWRTEETSANPDSEILGAIRPAMAQFPEALLLCASSPHSRRGELWRAYEKFYGKEDRRVLVWQAPTAVMNPSIAKEVIAEAYERDPAWAAAEYGATFRSDLETFVEREIVSACVDSGVRERPPVAGLRFESFTDPSGGSSDSMTCAVGHLQDGVVVIDALRERVAPFDPDSATAEFVELLKRYGIRRTNGDRYAAEWSAQSFEKKGIQYKHCELARSGLYLNLLPHLNSRTIRLLDHPKANNQICSLERSTGRGRADSVDHPRGAHDDLANCIAGLAHVLTNRRAAIPPSMESWSDLYGTGRRRAEAAARKQAEANVMAGSRACDIDFAKLERERTRNIVPGVTQRIGTITRIW